MQGQRSSFKGLLTIDDDTRALLDSLMHGRRRSLRFKPVLATWIIRSKTGLFEAVKD